MLDYYGKTANFGFGRLCIAEKEEEKTRKMAARNRAFGQKAPLAAKQRRAKAGSPLPIFSHRQNPLRQNRGWLPLALKA